ncbi:hypothetical protein [Microcoleus sp. AR_TQ3_B6]
MLIVWPRVLLVLLGIAICTPIGAVVGLLGCAIYLLAGLLEPRARY